MGQEAVRRDPHGPDWYHGNLATAYYLAGKPKEALAEIEKMGQPWTYLKAVIYVRLGRMEEGRAVIAEYLKKCPDCSIKGEAVWPGGKQPQMTEAVLKPYLDDLRRAGLPEG